MTVHEELDAAVATLAPPDKSPPRFEEIRRRQRRRRTEVLAAVVVLIVLVLGVGAVVRSGDDSPKVTSNPNEPASSVPITRPLPPGTDALGLTAQLPDGWTLQRGGCPATKQVTVVENATELPTPAGCPAVARPWMVIQRTPVDLDGIDKACGTLTADDMPVCQAMQVDPSKGSDRLGIDRRFYAALDVLVSVGRDASGAPAPEVSYSDPAVVQAVADGTYQSPQPLFAARSFVEHALANGCSSVSGVASRAAVTHCAALGLPADGVVREVGSGSSGGGPATYWIVTVDAPDGSHRYRVLVQNQWDRSQRWVTQSVGDITTHDDTSTDSNECPPPGDKRFLTFAGADCPGGAPSAIPDRVALPGTGFEPIGWIDRKAIERGPDSSTDPSDPNAAFTAWKHRLIPVSKTKKRSSRTVGYYVPMFGFIDKAVVDQPGFDLDALLAQGACDNGRRVVLVDGQATCA